MGKNYNCFIQIFYNNKLLKCNIFYFPKKQLINKSPKYRFDMTEIRAHMMYH